MDNGFIRKRLARAFARRLAGEMLADIDLAQADFADQPLTAEERLEVYAEIRRISAQLLSASEAGGNHAFRLDVGT
ncbi:hypothetical protein [Stutzerimonas stutzeri]|uniref:Uncharacterized protein n=1 Tax=Stutzerimonas stutzeri NF13 TaxID=1212548 RepID=M2VQJ8_STUST|nr:hypothetical protein [Stutzerimonas stutzeri]EME01874.1 hypothetical protein B381_01699 [Stutzerimonas stutzeri NF13]MCQ4243184.1 hypothetical protein [Stutzerimonas stutzeri]